MKQCFGFFTFLNECTIITDLLGGGIVSSYRFTLLPENETAGVSGFHDSLQATSVITHAHINPPKFLFICEWGPFSFMIKGNLTFFTR